MTFDPGHFPTVRHRNIDFVMPLWYEPSLAYPHQKPKEHDDWADFARPSEELLRPRESVGYLPVSTVLYHGTLHPHLNFHCADSIFFGLDALISLWYLHEMIDGADIAKPIGKLHVFEVVRRIPYFYQDRFKDEASRDEDIAVVHPQSTCRFESKASERKMYHELSTEVTIPFHFLPYLSHTHALNVDVATLIAHGSDTLADFNPVEAVTGLADAQDPLRRAHAVLAQDEFSDFEIEQD